MVGAGLLLASSGASASDTPKGEAPGGKGGKGPTPSAGPQEAATTPEEGAVQRGFESATKLEEKRPWEVGVDFETHRLIRQDDLEGAGSGKVSNILGVNALYRLTDRDQIGVREFFTEGFLVDDGETGVRSENVAFYYSHFHPLPRDFVFNGSFSISAPTSLGAQKAGLILAPTLVLGLNKRVGRYFTAGIHTNGTVEITKYREAEGGAPNPLAFVAFGLSAEVAMPFLESLSLGVTANTSYTWINEVQSSSPPQFGVTNDPTYPTRQPVQQNYGGEIFARYVMPTVADVKSEFSISLAQGGAGVGNTNYLHDGVGEFYLFYRLNSQVYASLGIRY